MLLQDRSLAVANFAELQELLTHGRKPGFFRRERPPKSDQHTIGQLPWPFREEPSAFEGKERAPELVHPDGHYLRIGLARDEFVAALQPQQGSGTRELSFGKQANNLSRTDFFRRRANRVLRAPCVNRNAARQVQKRMQDRIPVILIMNDEANRTRAGDLENDGVDPRDVIRQEQKTARRQSVAANRFDPVNETSKREADEVERAFCERGMRHLFMIYIRRDAHCNRQFDDGRSH